MYANTSQTPGVQGTHCSMSYAPSFTALSNTNGYCMSLDAILFRSSTFWAAITSRLSLDDARKPASHVTWCAPFRIAADKDGGTRCHACSAAGDGVPTRGRGGVPDSHGGIQRGFQLASSHRMVSALLVC